MTETLFTRLGSEAAVDAAVDTFYRKVLTDDTISRYFSHTDMDRQRAKQKAFLTMAFGGPSNYAGKDLRKAHKGLVARGLNDSHFDAVATHLPAVDWMDWARIPPDVRGLFRPGESVSGVVLLLIDPVQLSVEQ